MHGSLLTIGELLRNSGGFMLARFKEVCDTVLKYREHKDRLVRKTVIELLPLLATFCPDAFVRGYLAACLDYLIETLRGGHIRDAAYLALGEMAVAVGRHVVRANTTCPLESVFPCIITRAKSYFSCTHVLFRFRASPTLWR